MEGELAGVKVQVCLDIFVVVVVFPRHLFFSRKLLGNDGVRPGLSFLTEELNPSPHTSPSAGLPGRLLAFSCW